MNLRNSFRSKLSAVAALFVCAFPGTAMAEVADRVVASIKPVHSLVSSVMAGVGEPHLIIRSAVSPHTFSLRPSDSMVLENARVVFLVDELIEFPLIGPVNTLAHDARVVMLSGAKGLVHRPLREGGAFEAHDHGADEHHGHHEGEEHSDEEETHGHEEHGAFDPHIWLDPVNAKAMASMIASTLSEADPANAETYAANAEALSQRLEDLTAEIAAEMESVRDRPFVVFHDAYRHFEDRFGLRAVGSVVISVDQSPGVRRIMELRDKVHELGAVCVFAEVQFESRLVDTIIEGTSARTGFLDPIGATGEAGPEAYFDLIRNMAASFKSCLAPADQG